MAILHTHRRGLMLVERSRVHLSEGRTVYADAQGDAPVTRSWNIPSMNTSAVLLGQGCSITQPAARKLADDGVMLAFTGSGGLPFLSASQNYRPSDALQQWIAKWNVGSWRLKAAKALQRARVDTIRRSWKAYASEGFLGNPDPAVTRYAADLEIAPDIATLTGFEGACTKALYAEASRATGASWIGRLHGNGDDKANRYLDHGNYLAYGLAGVALWAVGIPPSLPVVHGRSNGGGLVFDLADVVKDAVILPTAFQCSVEPGLKAGDARQRMIDRLYDATFLDRNGCIGLLFDVIAKLVSLPVEDAA